MTELRLISGTALADPEVAEAPPLPRLSPGRHGMPADLVRAHQRRRLLAATAAALAEQGYGRLTAARVTELAGVSSRTFYQHFEDLWACVLAAYEEGAARLCERIESIYTTERRRGFDRMEAQTSTAPAGEAGIGAAIELLAAEPDVARLLSAEPPPQIAALAAARRELIERLGAMLRKALAERDGATPLPGLERRLVGAALALVATRAAGGDPERLRALQPELTELLLASL